MKANFPVSFKGNLMVSIPLLFMLVFATILTMQINQAESSRMQLAEARELLSTANKVGYTEYRAFSCVYFFSLMGGMPNQNVVVRLKRRYKGYTEDLLAAVTDLTRGTKSHPDLEAKAVNFENYIKQLIRLMDQAVYEVPQGQKFQFLSDNQATFVAIGDELDKVVAPLRQLDSATPQAMNELFARLVQTVEAGLAASVIVALSLSAFFSADISQRIKKLASNVLRFSNREELLPAIGGADEIAQLDLSFRLSVRQLHEAEETKRRYYAAVTQDMKAPMEKVGHIVNRLLAGQEGSLSDAARTRLTTVRNNLDRITLLVQDLEDMENVNSGSIPLEKSTVSSGALLQTSKQLLEATANARKITIAIEDLAQTEVSADEKRLGQILVNFLSNAIKYSPENSTIVMRASRSGDALRFEVTDQGPGITDDAKAKLFQKFQQVSESDAQRGAGTGLGLAVSKLIAESHGGAIGVDSTAGKGSTFWFTLPTSA